MTKHSIGSIVTCVKGQLKPAIFANVIAWYCLSSQRSYQIPLFFKRVLWYKNITKSVPGIECWLTILEKSEKMRRKIIKKQKKIKWAQRGLKVLKRTYNNGCDTKGFWVQFALRLSSPKV